VGFGLLDAKGNTVHLGFYELSGDREKTVRKIEVRKNRGCNTKRSFENVRNLPSFSQ
jgi:hypothetical protein